MKLAQHNGGCVVVQNIEIYEKDNRFFLSVERYCKALNPFSCQKVTKQRVDIRLSITSDLHVRLERTFP